jgi:hypothetical protein
VNFKERSFIAWLGVQAVKKLSLRIKGTVTKPKLIAAARAGRNIDMFGLFKWCPACKGPASYPRSTNGRVWATRFVNGVPVLLAKKPIDAWKVLGLKK